jgi:hypothetical protein
MPVGFGDFDGDGRTDVLVGLLFGNTPPLYLVPGTVAPGTRDPAAAGVGVRVPRPVPEPTGDYSTLPGNVGDQDHDGADDLIFGPRIYSGKALSRLPAGAALPAPIRTLVGPVVGVLQLDSASTPALVIRDNPWYLEVLDARHDVLAIHDHGGASADELKTGGEAFGWVLPNGHHIVDFDRGTRGGTTTWRFDLDGACGS